MSDNLQLSEQFEFQLYEPSLDWALEVENEDADSVPPQFSPAPESPASSNGELEDPHQASAMDEDAVSSGWGGPTGHPTRGGLRAHGHRGRSSPGRGWASAGSV